MFLPVTLWLTPGNSQLGKMLSCISNRYSTGMCPGRPEHPCLPNRRVSLPPTLPQHIGRWSPFAHRLACCVGCVYEAPVSGPALGVLPKRPYSLTRLQLLHQFSQEAKPRRAATPHSRLQAASDPSNFGQNNPGQEALQEAQSSPATHLALTGEGEGKRRGQRSLTLYIGQL